MCPMQIAKFIQGELDHRSFKRKKLKSFMRLFFCWDRQKASIDDYTQGNNICSTNGWPNVINPFESAQYSLILIYWLVQRWFLPTPCC